MEVGKLRLKTLKLLQERRRGLTLKMVSVDTGLTEIWLKSFLRRAHEKDAGSDRIVLLYEYLTKSKLKI